MLKTNVYSSLSLSLPFCRFLPLPFPLLMIMHSLIHMYMYMYMCTYLVCIWIKSCVYESFIFFNR